MLIPAWMLAQNEDRNSDIVSIEESDVETRIKLPGITVSVNQDSDTVTRIVIGSQQLEVIEDNSDGKVSRIRMVHAPRTKFKGHWDGVELGLNNFFSRPFDSNLPPEAHYLDLNAGKSVVVGVNLLKYSKGIQRNKNNIGFVTGLGLTINNYRFDSPYILTRMENGDTGYEAITRPINKNKLVTTFLTAPLLLEVQFPDGHNHPFYISGGVYGGFRIGAHTKVKYADDAKRQKVKSHKDINLNSFKYGIMVRAGYRWLNLYATSDMSRLFQKGQGPDIYPWAVGILFSF
jgi:hypothetical protein